MVKQFQFGGTFPDDIKKWIKKWHANPNQNH